MFSMHLRKSAIRLAGLFLLFTSVCVAGCGTQTAQVTGKVTSQDQPVPGAELTFQPVADPGDQFSGMCNTDGSFLISSRGRPGLPIGAYKVTVTRYATKDGKTIPPGEQGDVLKNTGKTIREAYEFEQTLTAGSNSVNLELSKGKKVQADQ